MIDLHSHTNQSDGTFSPAQLVAEASRVGVRFLAVTDHDTFAGYDQALPFARSVDMELICGIELSTKLGCHSTHLLGYFFITDHLAEFRTWVLELQALRRERNGLLAARLRELGLHVTLEEVEARSGGMTGRPHFAQVMVEKQYVRNIQEAFDDYLNESAQAYVERREPQFDEGVERIRKANGIASLAHPVRLREELPSVLPRLRNFGLNAIEAYHSDHGLGETDLYLSLAEQYGLLVTGGSDFHGTLKPGVELGTGRHHNLKIPRQVIDRLRSGK